MTPFFLLQTFLEYLEVEKRYSVHTVKAYKTDLTQLLDQFELNSINDLDDKLIRHWVVELHESGVSNRSINRKLSSLRAFQNWLRREQYTDQLKKSKVKGPKVEKRLPAFVKESVMRNQNLDLEPHMSFEEARDHLMIEVLYQTGMRLSELIELQDGNVTSDRILVYGKRKKERWIPISNQLFDNIQIYRNIKSNLNVNSPYFFIKSTGDKLYPKLVYRKINNYLGKVTDLDKRGPHVLRHTFATHMLNNGAGLETIKDLLGHANLSATQVYTHNSFTKLSSIYSQAHPRGHKTG